MTKNKLIAEERAINLTRSFIDKWASKSLKDTNSELIQEHSRALYIQFKANATNAPLNLSNNETKELLVTDIRKLSSNKILQTVKKTEY